MGLEDNMEGQALLRELGMRTAMYDAPSQGLRGWCSPETKEDLISKDLEAGVELQWLC